LARAPIGRYPSQKKSIEKSNNSGGKEKGRERKGGYGQRAIEGSKKRVFGMDWCYARSEILKKRD
jgi:hypothetical protein